jgi:2',3'-cyclic-nucleotide 2'-phosphodiesterase (5'-nucleotidase family)
VARRATAIGKERSGSSAVLLLDAGNTLSGQELATRSQGKIIVEAMNKLGYDAMGLGLTDLSIGREALDARSKEASFPIVSANLVDESTGKPILPEYAVIQKGGRKIAIVGITGVDDLANGAALGLKVADPIQAAKDAVARARQEADAVIVISRLGAQDDRRLATEVEGVAVVVGGVSYSPDESLWRADNTGTVVVHPGAQGENVGVLNLKIASDGKVSDPDWRTLRLDKNYSDDQGMLDLVAKYSSQ